VSSVRYGVSVKLPAAAILLSASVAGAAPWKLETDFDGAGPVTRIELDAKGELVITTGGVPQTLHVANGVARATLQAAHTMGTPTIVVDADQEAIVLQSQPRGWAEVARSKVGGGGLDAEYTTEVSATASGVYRYEARPGYRRCDGKPALMFAEYLAGKDWKPLLKAPADLPASAPVLVAHTDPAAALPPMVFQARAASYQVGATNAGALAIPSELDDGKLATAWVEDLPASAGEGEFFTFERRLAKAKAAQLRVVPAHEKNVNRPKRLGVVWAGGAAHVEVPDGAIDAPGTAYVVDLPAPIDGCVTVIVESTYGPQNGKTAIPELEVFAEGERNGGGETLLAAAVAAGSDGERAAAQELARRGAAGAAAIDAELSHTGDEAARRRLVHALIGVHDPAAAAPLAHAVKEKWLQGPDLVEAIAALGKLGQTAQVRELAAADDVGVEARIAAIQALATADPKLVIDVAGLGPRAMRRAAIDALATLPVATLLPAAQGAQSAMAAGDLWRIEYEMLDAVAADRAAALAAMTAALPSANDYERRYRLIEGIAALGDAAAITQVRTLLHSLPADGATAAYEQAAARSIADNPRPEALAFLLELARDKDAGVRLTALGALSTSNAGTAWHGAEDTSAIDRAIATMLASDGWPEVRRRAAQVLGGRCTRPDPAKALEASFARDPDILVRGDALSALVDCKAAGVAEVLARTWNDGKQPLPLRQRAVDLAANLEDHALADRLAKDFARWRGEALESGEALALAQNAAYALGRLATPAAVHALEVALDDGTFPELVGASATGLGLLGKACPASAKPKLESLARSEDEQVAGPARRAAALCGK